MADDQPDRIQDDRIAAAQQRGELVFTRPAWAIECVEAIANEPRPDTVDVHDMRCLASGDAEAAIRESFGVQVASTREADRINHHRPLVNTAQTMSPAALEAWSARSTTVPPATAFTLPSANVSRLAPELNDAEASTSTGMPGQAT